MDRNIVYPGAIPLDTDILTTQRSIMVALGFIAQATLGTGTVFDGLACTQQAVPDMTVKVGPGSALFLSTVDATTFGSLAADTADALVKMGTNLGSTTLATPSAGSGGQSTNYLIQAAFQESDATSVILPYYNSANPAVPYSGPANSGTPQNTQRIQKVNIGVKAGTPATTGTQTTPAPDAGFTGLYVVTVAFGATSVVNANIAVLAAAPFIQYKLPQLRPGTSSGSQYFTSNGTFTVPAGVTLLEVELWGGGGGGSGVSGASGAGGGYSKGRLAVTPGQTITATVGAAGAGNVTVGSATGGGTTTFSTISATGGGPGNAGASAGGVGSGGYLNLNGQAGTDLDANTPFAPGGNAPRGGQGGSINASGAQNVPTVPGGGAASSSGSTSFQSGASGAILVTW